MMKKILIINTIGVGYEGISTVIFNYLEHMDRNDFDFHFPIFQDTNTEICLLYTSDAADD